MSYSAFLVTNCLTILQRIMSNALSQWTTRVADNKFRELEVAQQNDREAMGYARCPYLVCRAHLIVGDI